MANLRTLCVGFSEFNENVLSNWQNFKTTKEFCDVTLVCGDNQIKAHKLIVSAISPVLRNILTLNPNPIPLIYLRGVKFTDLESLVQYMYQGEVDVIQKDVDGFLAVAEDLKIIGLTQGSKNPMNSKATLSGINSPSKSVEKCHKLEKNEIEIIDQDNILESDIVSSEAMEIRKDELPQKSLVINKIMDISIEADTLSDENLKNRKNELPLKSESKSSLDYNWVNPERAVSCDKCEKLFTSHNNFKKHFKSFHEEVRYFCDKCDFEAKYLRRLTAHKASVHCKECDFKTYRKTLVDIHYKKVHNSNLN